jgi:cyclopropane-fatty-acyl-phospholipid synthase
MAQEREVTGTSVDSSALLGRAQRRRGSSLGASLAGRALTGLIARGGRRALELHEGGRTRILGDGPVVARVEVHDARAYRALALHGSIGLGESYVAGWWDADDLAAVLGVLVERTARWRALLDRVGSLSRPLDPLAQRLAPDRGRDKRNIAAHYDLSNDFFALMLDETMTYSCAFFEHEGQDLATAQRAKLDRLFDKLELGPEDHLLEIGTGWGGLAVRAATERGCRVTTTTISAEQRAWALRAVAEAGLEGRVEVLEVDWRDLEGTFDKLVSVEMIEAVDWRLHDAFFAACSRLLAPDGLAVLQAIVIEDASFQRAKRHRDFIRAMVFPDGFLPSVASMRGSIQRASDLHLVDLEDLGPHYAETLRRWRRNLEAHDAALDDLELDLAFRRLWDLYLAYCEAAFEERHVTDVQVVLAKPGWRPRGVPPTPRT